MKFWSSLILTLVLGDLAVAKPLIGYGSSNAVLPAKNQELFYSGFELGLKDNLKVKLPPDFLKVRHHWDGQHLGATRSARQLLDDGAQMLVGFPTSHEALLAAEIASKDSTLSIFAGAGHSKLNEMGPTVFSTGESMKDSMIAVLDLIGKIQRDHSGALIINPFAVFSTNQELVLRDLLKQPTYSEIRLETFHLDKGMRFAETDLIKLKEGKFDYLFYTPYADESLPSLEQTLEKGIDLPVISNTAWTTADIDFIRRVVSKKKQPTYSITLFDKDSEPARRFESRIKKAYGRTSSSELAYGYDLGAIVAGILNGAKTPYTKASLLAEMHRKSCFTGGTTEKICFDATGGHAHRKLYPVLLTPDGLKTIRQQGQNP
jgi:ABC-type branched-subunit amino acid transport system substrate-binding protein